MIDQVEFEVIAGTGGNGIVSFRREKYVPKGGPDGGDGGRGANVRLVAGRMVSGLGAYRDRRLRGAPDGEAGSSNNRRGASGDDLVLLVPVGCVVWDLDALPGSEPLTDLVRAGADSVVARGGRGGWGNKRFATPARRTPRFSQKGAAGERRRLRLELKLLADVGLVGLPNAGKSTLLGAWSAAHPKVADYPFTTLEPELGVVELGYDSFVAADMPGLIEGASSGIGLGHEFLRHIERTRVIVHVLDMTRDDPLSDLKLINRELAAFGHGLSNKPQILALNKVDVPDAQAHVELLQHIFDAQETSWFGISATSTQGTRQLAERTFQVLQQQLANGHAEQQSVPVIEPREIKRERFRIERDINGKVVVKGRTPEWLAATFDLEDAEAREELLDRLRRLGLARALAREGVTPGTSIHIGEVLLVWE